MDVWGTDFSPPGFDQKERIIPDFICIGGQRTGTTWLHHVLSANDTVWLPPCKELHHFDTLCPEIETYPYRYRSHLPSRLRHYGLAAARTLSGRTLRPDVRLRLDWDWDLRYFLQQGRSIDWYRSLFDSRAAQGRVTGEITPAYSILPPTHIERIARQLPDVRIILILRDPVLRAWSHALKDLPAAAIGDEQQIVDFMRTPGCVARSNWPLILDRWRVYIPPERFLTLDFDMVKTQPTGFVDAVGSFLGVKLQPPGDGTGASERERGGSSKRAKSEIPDEVLRGIADLYVPILNRSSEVQPEISAFWRKANARMLNMV